jgi:hypothetical protein
MRSAAFSEILRVLTEERVEFVVVGMTAGILQGAPTTTLDLDIVHRRTPENIARLLRALASLDATYRHDSRTLRPGESHLESPGHQLLTTAYGDFDCLGTIDDGRAYEDLLEQTVSLKIGNGAAVRVLDLRTLIDFKERSGRPKDLAALPVLRATLAEIERGKDR